MRPLPPPVVEFSTEKATELKHNSKACEEENVRIEELDEIVENLLSDHDDRELDAELA